MVETALVPFNYPKVFVYWLVSCNQQAVHARENGQVGYLGDSFCVCVCVCVFFVVVVVEISLKVEIISSLNVLSLDEFGMT